jgi:hypothetical protein
MPCRTMHSGMQLDNDRGYLLFSETKPPAFVGGFFIL